MNLPQIVFIVGPTAVGKSDIAVALAQKINGEIVSADSMQVYKEVEIANNKPLNMMMEAVPHHLINVISVEEEFDVAKFYKLAQQAVEDIYARNHVPIVVGGSGLYVQVLLNGIFEGNPKNEEFRQELYQLVEEKDNEFLYKRLKKQDPQSAERIHPNDIKRVVRALEVCELGGQPISQVQKERKGFLGKYDIKGFNLNRDREELYNKINRRVDEMVMRGLVDEIRGLESLKLSRTAQMLIGVKEVKAFFNGEYDVENAFYFMKRNTRQFAKRQITWFKRTENFEWLKIKEGQSAEDMACILEKSLQCPEPVKF
ncbi:tRNA dimethylallyltransferase [hydrothermal vent metagenome]|uniref:tRNA dimethylallyltransferase n=1 Tax=hydrothermal vent metagenome TaxID=652676 RepID=A0A3B1D4C8_9ZZZZ